MMLLDTCTLIWLVCDPDQLSVSAREAIGDNGGRLCVSAFSAFEIGLLVAKGKIRFAYPPGQWFAEALRSRGIREWPLDARCCMRATELPRHHNDPADRLLIATAMINRMTLITPDPHIRMYEGVQTLW